MKKLLILLFSIVILFTGCSKNTGNTPSGQEICPDGYTPLEVEAATGVKVEGIGVQFDPHYFSQNASRNVRGLDESGWELMSDRVHNMGIDKFRVMILPEWIEPQNDNADTNETDWSKLTIDSNEINSLYRLLDLAEEEHIDVTFVLWGVSRYYTIASNNFEPMPYFMAEGNDSKNWVVGAKGVLAEEYIENLIAYLQLLIEQKGYTCIKEVTPGNEPDWSWQIDGGTLGDAQSYVEMCIKLDERLKAVGLRDKVELNLVDTTYDRNDQWLQMGVDYLGDIADVFNTHTYNFGYDTANSAIRAWERNNSRLAASVGLTHFVGEFGSNQTVGSTRQKDIDTFERGVYIVRLMNNFFNGGACGMSYWTLNDYYINKTADYGQMMQLGLWRSAKDEYITESYYRQLEDFQVRDQYYAFSLMTKHVPIGADVYPIDTFDELTAATAFCHNGKTVYSFANAGTEDHKFALKEIDGEFAYYIYAKDSLPTTDALIEQSAVIKAENGYIAIDVPANTVVLVKEK